MAGAQQIAFEELALVHLDLLYRVARRLARDPHEAEDLVQETYLKAYKAFGSFEVREFGVRPWLLKILNNTFINRLARQKRAPKATDQQLLEEGQSGDLPPPPSLEYEHLDEEVREALDGLSPEFRSVLLLWATNELSYQEIAEVLDVPIGTVMSRLHRARQQLARALDDYAREHGLGSHRRA